VLQGSYLGTSLEKSWKGVARMEEKIIIVYILIIVLVIIAGLFQR